MSDSGKKVSELSERKSFSVTTAPSLVKVNKVSAEAVRRNSSLREFDLTEKDFGEIKELIHQKCGIVLSPSKKDMVYGRLSKRLRELKFTTFSSYIQRLKIDKQELEGFINALTTNLTSFFREAHHFDILEKKLKEFSANTSIKIWCNASSTGEEPYSIAITACEAFNSLSPPVKIIATDINTYVLTEAFNGVYKQDKVTGLKPLYIQKYFLKDKNSDATGLIKVRPEVKRLIQFSQLNLVDERWALSGPFDIVFCRNVMIYFDKKTQYDILKRFLTVLKPEGFLFAGHSESFLHASDLFVPLGRTVYRRANKK